MYNCKVMNLLKKIDFNHFKNRFNIWHRPIWSGTHLGAQTVQDFYQSQNYLQLRQTDLPPSFRWPFFFFQQNDFRTPPIEIFFSPSTNRVRESDRNILSPGAQFRNTRLTAGAPPPPKNYPTGFPAPRKFATDSIIIQWLPPPRTRKKTGRTSSSAYNDRGGHADQRRDRERKKK